MFLGKPTLIKHLISTASSQFVPLFEFRNSIMSKFVSLYIGNDFFQNTQIPYPFNAFEASIRMQVEDLLKMHITDIWHQQVKVKNVQQIWDRNLKRQITYSSSMPLDTVYDYFPFGQ